LSTEERRARVASTFRNGANVLFGTDLLICFHSPGVPLGPWGVEAPLDWKQVCVNDRVAARAGDVRVGLLSLSLDRAEVHDLRLSAVAGPIDLRSLADRAKALKDLRARCSAEESGRSTDCFGAACQRVLDAWVSNGSLERLSELIGLGIGLTPAGDDILVGILGGLEILVQITKARPALLNGLRATHNRLGIIIGEKTQEETTLPSAQMLRCAVDGRFCEPLVELLAALCESATTAAELQHLAQCVLRLGHSSGADLLAGVIATLKWGLSRSN